MPPRYGVTTIKGVGFSRLRESDWTDGIIVAKPAGDPGQRLVSRERRSLGSCQQRGGALPHSLNPFITPPPLRFCLGIALSLILCVVPGLSQKTQPKQGSAPKYDRQTETSTKGVVEEVNQIAFGTRKDFTEVVIKSGEDHDHTYLCPRPF